jgi:hypothetical protein
MQFSGCFTRKSYTRIGIATKKNSIYTYGRTNGYADAKKMRTAYNMVPKVSFSTDKWS